MMLRMGVVHKFLAIKCTVTRCTEKNNDKNNDKYEKNNCFAE